MTRQEKRASMFLGVRLVTRSCHRTHVRTHLIVVTCRATHGFVDGRTLATYSCFIALRPDRVSVCTSLALASRADSLETAGWLLGARHACTEDFYALCKCHFH